ncbi:MAG TPA: AAA family ATPase [Steroidobacteraceae bacterium]|nr:AAA family ATPase [Steroidobacteraceae bacterium]
MGRSREFAALASALDAADGGRGTLCLISGEPGIGKSRLLAQFAAEQARRCPAMHWGLAWESGGAPVYWPWIQILRSLLSRECARAALRDMPHIVAPLAELVPELLPLPRAEAVRLEPEQARFRLMDAVSTLLAACAAQEALVMVLEDLHAADSDSLLLLEFAIRQLHGARVLVVGSLRDAEIERPRIGNIVARLSRAAIQLPLRRLDRDDVREYLRVSTGERPLEQEVAALLALTEGHPLYLAEVVELGLERGTLLNAPSSIRLAVLERASQLPETTRALLGTASVLGRSFQLEALAEISACTEEQLRERLEPALASGLLERDSGALRFEHMLVREAFHESLPATERRRLHEREAQRMRARADRGTTISWAALAQHLEESAEQANAETIEAWRQAAHQAEARHSFDAALCYQRALQLVGEGAGGDGTRARLLLELAAAQIRAGDLDAGRRNSAEAFRIGEALDDAPLLADAALTYGSIFIFGCVDPRLVGLLKAALARLGEGDIDRRARLQARLAAAMQPAADPAEPAGLAREAIALARSAGDARTLLTTLRSAVSALMDLGDPVERLALNQEYVRLARQLGDNPECMRGHLRSAVDAMELAEAAILDESIAQCDRLAEQLCLPHYQWTAAALRVMRATSRGEFADAEAALARARRLADRAQDSNAPLTLLVQQLALAEIMEDREQLEALCARLERESARLTQSDLYLKPALLAAATRSLGRRPSPAELDEAGLRAILRFCDMGAFTCLGDYLPALGNRALVDLAYESLLPFEDRCGHWGMLGLRWMGPVARSLAMLAVAQRRFDVADEHFAKAVELARRMQARPWICRIVLDWLEAARAAGVVSRRALAQFDEALATADELGLQSLQQRLLQCREPAPRDAEPAPIGPPAVAGFRVAPDGEVWVCECGGTTFRLRDSRGMQILARLVAAPGREIHVLDLIGANPGDQPVDSGDCGEALDEQARRDYRRRLESLREQLEEAESRHDLAAAEAAREEIELLSAELSRAFGLGGRARRTGSNVERARVNVQRRLKHAIDRIASECPPAGKHLNWAIRTGSFCSYQPD